MTNDDTSLAHAEPTSLAPGPVAVAAREFLAFEVGAEQYAMPLVVVQEILRVPTITDVPRGPRDILGVISVRGSVTSLVDLRRRLQMPEAPIENRARVLLVARDQETVGLLVDRVLQVVRLTDDELEMASVLGQESSSYVMGVGRPKQSEFGGRKEHILIILDPAALLRDLGAL